MRVDFQQVFVQTVNVDRVQTNVGNPQVAEAVQHAQKTAEDKEAQRKSATIVETDKGERVEPLSDEEKRRKALFTNKQNKEKDEEEKEEEKKENELPPFGRKIDIRT